MERVPKLNIKQSKRHEPLAFAYVGLILFMVVYFGRPEDWIPGLTTAPLAKITGILMFLAMALSFSQIRWNLPKGIIFLTLLVVQLWLAAVFSPLWKGGAIKVMLDFSKVLPLVIVIHGAVRSMNRLRGILLVQAASVAAIACASILNRHISGGRLQGALSGIYGNPNDLALAIDLTLPLCLALALVTRSFWMRFAWTTAMLIMIYAVLLTASRAGALALVVATLVCVWQLGVRERRFYLLLLVPLAVVVIWLRSGTSLERRIEQTTADSTTNHSRTEAELSALQRKELLSRSLEATAQHPLFGIGPGNFPIISGNWHVTHNSYTQISAEGGVPALLFYVLIFWYGIVNLREVSNSPKTGKRIGLVLMALKASLAAYLVGSFFASDAYQLFPYCIVAYTSALRLVVRKTRIVSSPTLESPVTPDQIESPVWQ